MHTNTHGYIVKYITNEEVFIMDDGLEKLLKRYRQNQCWSVIQHRLVEVIALYVYSYYSSNIICMIRTIQLFMFSVASN